MSSRRSEERSGTGAALACVAAALGLLFAAPILAGERFYFRDLSQNHGPLIEGARRLLGAGEPLWWNPWAGGGEPLLANPNHLLLTPAGLLALAGPTGSGLSLAIVGSSFLSALFLVLLLRDLGRSPWASATGGLVYALSGCCLSAGTLPNVIAASSWIPPALFFLGRAAANRAWLPAAVLSSAFVILPCEPSSALALLAFALILTLADAAESAPSATQGSRPRALLAPGIMLALGASAAAVQILPAVHWVAASARGAGLPPGEVAKWSLSLRRLPEVVAPGFLGDPARIQGWWSSGIFETGYPFYLSLYLGLPALCLALLGALPRRRAQGGASGMPPGERVRMSGIAIASLAFLVLAQGSLVRALAGSVPGVDLFRYPEKFLLGTVLGIAILAAGGVDRLREAEVPGRRLAAAACGGAVVLLLAALILASGAGSWFSLPDGAASLRALAVVGVRWSLVWGALAAAPFAVLVLIMERTPAQTRGPLVAASVALSLVVGAAAPSDTGPLPWRIRSNPSAPAALLSIGPLFAERLESLDPRAERFVRMERPAGFAMRSITGTIADLFAWERRSLERSSATAFGIPLIFDRSTDRLDPPGHDEADRYFRERPIDERTRIWSLTSVRYVLAYDPIGSPSMKLVETLEGESRTPVLLYEHLEPRPRAWIALAVEEVASDEAAFRGIASAHAPEGAASGVVYLLGDGVPSGGAAASRSKERNVPAESAEPASLEERGASAEGPSKLAGRREVTVRRRGAGRLTIDVGVPEVEPPTGTSGGRAAGSVDWLVVSENDLPGWSATVDARDAPIVRANGMQIAVPVPLSGRHVVELAYFPPGLLQGAAVSVIALGLSVLLVFTGPRSGDAS